MENYEKYGSITISPTAITDKEQTYELHQRSEGGSDENDDWDMRIELDTLQSSITTDNVVIICDDVKKVIDDYSLGIVPKILIEYKHMYAECLDGYKKISEYYLERYPEGTFTIHAKWIGDVSLTNVSFFHLQLNIGSSGSLYSIFITESKLSVP